MPVIKLVQTMAILNAFVEAKIMLLERRVTKYMIILQCCTGIIADEQTHLSVKIHRQYYLMLETSCYHLPAQIAWQR